MFKLVWTRINNMTPFPHMGHVSFSQVVFLLRSCAKSEGGAPPMDPIGQWDPWAHEPIGPMGPHGPMRTHIHINNQKKWIEGGTAKKSNKTCMCRVECRHMINVPPVWSLYKDMSMTFEMETWLWSYLFAQIGSGVYDCKELCTDSQISRDT